MKIRSKATLTLRAMLARRYGFGASPNKQIFTDGPQGRACENSFCGHRSIACHLAAPPESPQKQEKRRPFLLDLRFSGFL